MKKVLYVDCCVRRKNSRTAVIAKHFLDKLDKNMYDIEELCLMDEPMEY